MINPENIEAIRHQTRAAFSNAQPAQLVYFPEGLHTQESLDGAQRLAALITSERRPDVTDSNLYIEFPQFPQAANEVTSSDYRLFPYILETALGLIGFLKIRKEEAIVDTTIQEIQHAIVAKKTGTLNVVLGGDFIVNPEGEVGFGPFTKISGTCSLPEYQRINEAPGEKSSPLDRICAQIGK
ncbi:hypothetical protein A3A66_04530 [Microgenomates group bacterium RIFCSPLOWO2_01_FULL_46_13]|nr:MAG: hypothetical protein A3A66_04530 [Microgenomates group bacterium RIFCSPLOWO2_01_FULL_46_13]